MKLVKEHINERFTDDDSDPIHDMGIGRKHIIEKWLKEHNVKEYVINDDFTIDAYDSVDFYNIDMHNFPEYIQFNKIFKGYFDIRKNNFTTLRGCPKIVNAGFFACSDNYLKTLKYSPSYVYGDFACERNFLKSLKYAPTKCERSFICYQNKVKFFKKDVLKVCDVDEESIQN